MLSRDLTTRMLGQQEDSSLFRCAWRASLLKHVSFAGQALGPIKLAKLFPEINPFARHFGHNSLSQWRSSMELDRSIAGRSLKLGLCSRLQAKRVIAQTLDDYMLEMHAEKLANLLESFTAFANRISPLIQNDPNAPAWWLNSQVLVQRKHWSLLTRRVTALIRIISDRLDKNIRQKQSDLPGEDRLRKAAHTALWIYG